MTRKDLSRRMARNYDITISDAAWMVEAVLDTVAESLMDKESIYMSNLGTLKPYFKKPQKFRHPSTGETRVRPGTFIIKFAAAKSLLNEMNERYGASAPDDISNEGIEE